MSEFFPPFVGGGQIHALEIVRNLAKTYRFEIITNRLVDSEPFEAHEGHNVYRVGTIGPVDSFVRRIRYILGAKSMAHKIHKEDPFDVIHSHVFAGSLAGYSFANKASLPIINTVHGVYLNDPSVGFIKRAFQKYVVNRNYSKTIAVSEMTKRQLIHLGLNEKSIDVIHNGVDISMFDLGKRKCNEVFTVVYVGRLWKIKGVHHLVKSAAQITKSNKNIRFIIVGDGPMRGGLVNYISQHGLKDIVTITGFKNYSEIPSVLREADLFVLPSLMEGLPNSLLEAMAAKLPVIATKVGGIPEIITSMENGLLIEPDSPDELTNAILTLVHDQDLRNKLAIQGYDTIRDHFKWSDAARKVSMIYEKLIDSQSS